MTHRKRGPFSIAAACILVPAVAIAATQEREHPEHPEKKQEHPEHPEQEHPGSPVTKEAIGQALSRYVQGDSELKGGWFLVWDRRAEKPLVLTLDKVHDDKLAAVQPELYFACVDFTTKDGEKTYDVDFFLEGKTAETLEVTEIAIHKEDGEPRYDWVEEGGFWKKRERETK